MARSSSVSLGARRSSIELRSKATDRLRRSSSKSRCSRSRIPHTTRRRLRPTSAKSRTPTRNTAATKPAVTKRLVQLPNGRVDLVFTINEGDKTGIRDIRFVGNHAVSNYRLRSLMQTSTMNWLSWFKSTDVYDPDRLASDLEAIRRYYMKNGYADFQITNTDVAYQANPPGYVITITMDEGPQYHVSSVAVVSNIPKVDGPALNRFVALRPGRRLRRKQRRQVGGGRSPATSPGKVTLSRRRGRMASATPPTIRSRFRSRSTTVRKSTSSASTLSGTPAPATSSFVANSISARATPIITS